MKNQSKKINGIKIFQLIKKKLTRKRKKEQKILLIIKMILTLQLDVEFFCLLLMFFRIIKR